MLRGLDTAFNAIFATVELLLGRHRGAGSTVDRIKREVDRIRHLSDAELRSRAGDALAWRRSASRGDGDRGRESTGDDGTRSRSYLDPRLSPSDLRAVALAIEAFRRAPADLPEGSVLYPQQIQAAEALTRPTVIQMDTGEGKTYAILPAAFALLCRFKKVYIVCANPYLAYRDANRTQPFWSFLGVDVGFCEHSTVPADRWSPSVVYTTFQALVFKELSEEIQATAPEHPIETKAVIIDEADAVLLDLAEQPYALVEAVSGEGFDWTASLDLVDALGFTPDDVEVDLTRLTGRLTQRGETRLRERVGPTLELTRYAAIRFSVVQSYLARHVVREGVDYLVRDGRALPVDRVSGNVQPGRAEPWLLPLEASLGLEPQPRKLTLNVSTVPEFFQLFEHVSAISGTVKYDIVEYVFEYNLIPVVIAPRVARHRGRTDDAVYLTKEQAIRGLVGEALRAHAAGRAVLVGTQSVREADAVHRYLVQAAPATATVQLFRDDGPERVAAELFRNAGRGGVITVATQLAGRGVDIRLDADVVARGGLVLLCLEHATEPRHDRQFLGRAGRQGEPFSARFYCSYDDHLLRAFANKAMVSLLSSMGAADEPVEARMVTNAIANAQQRLRENRRRLRLGQTFMTESRLAAKRGLRRWFEWLQGRPGDDSGTELPDDLIRSIIERYLRPSLVRTWPRYLDRDAASTVVANLARGLARAPDDLPVAAADLEGRNRGSALAYLRDAFGHELERRFERYRQRVTELSRRVEVGMDQTRELERTREAIDRVARTAVDAQYTVRNAAEAPDGPGAPASSGADRSATARLDALEPPGRATDLDAAVAEVAALISSTVLSDGEFRRCNDLLAGARTEVESRLLTEHAALARTGAEWELVAARSPRSVVRWVILQSWMAFLDERERIQSRVAKRSLAPLNHYQAIVRSSEREWEVHESTLPGKIVASLLSIERPELLDDLFWIDDSRVSVATQRDLRFDWRPPRANLEGAAADRPNRTVATDDLVETFVDHAPASLSGQQRARLVRLCLDFLHDHPLEVLQSSEDIYRALRTWRDVEVERGVSDAARSFNRTWIPRFLGFLRSHHLVAPLPTLRSRARARLGQVVSGFTNPKFLLAAICLVVAVGSFAAAYRVGAGSLGRDLDPLARLLDALLFAGLISLGSITAPWFALPAVVKGLLGLLDRRGAPSAPKLVTTPRSLWWLGSSLIALVLLPWPTDLATLLANLGWFVLIVLSTLYAVYLATVIYRFSGVDLTAAWLGFSVVWAFWPHLVGRVAIGWVQGTVLVAVAVAAAATRRWSSVSVEIEASDARAQGGAIVTDETTAALRLHGDPGFSPVGLGLALALLARWTLGQVPADLPGGVLAAVPVAVYLAGWYAEARRILLLRLSETYWERHLEDGTMRLVDRRDIRALVRAFRRRALAVQTLVQAVSLGFVFGVLRLAAPDPATTAWLAVAWLGSLYLFVDQGGRFVRQLGVFVGSRATFATIPFDLPTDDDGEAEALPLVRRAWRVLRRHPWRVVLALWGVLAAVTQAVDVVQTLVFLRERIADIVQLLRR